jgi:hypothetical protein
MTNLQERESICRECPQRRTAGLFRWCAERDETHGGYHDCSRSRSARFSARLTLPHATCDRWNTTGTLYLPDIPTVVYTCDKPHCVARHPRVARLLESLDFTDWRFHWGPAGNPYWQPIRPDYVGLLRDHEPPFLILEDDVGLRDFRSWISPPPESEIVYLGGGGSWRGGRLVTESQRHLPEHTIRRVGEIGFEDLPEHPDWVRVFVMFGTHAVLWLDKRVMIEAADAIEADPVQVDVVLGKNQWRWHAVLRKTPMFYQDDGHNNAGTWDYTTPRPPVTREQRRQLAHAARGR